MAAAGPDRPPQPFPWAAVMELGLARLRLSPQQFWMMTVAELLSAAGRSDAQAFGPPARVMLDALMARWPDHPEPNPKRDRDNDR